MTLKHIPTKALIPKPLHAEVQAFVGNTAGLSLTHLVRVGLRRWLERVEGEEFMCKAFESRPIKKPAGAPYPPATGAIPQGRPLGSKDRDKPMRSIAFRLDEDFDTRIRNALFWRSEWMSHVVAEALRSELNASM